MLKKIKILCLLLFIFALAGCEVKESDKKDEQTEDGWTRTIGG